MRKAGFKRMRGVKEDYVQDLLRLKRIFCTSIKHVRWMKRYINRAPRHKEKREDGAVVVACENSTGFAYIEEFDSVKAAIKWLRREE